MIRASLHVEPRGALQIARVREVGASRALIANVTWWRAGGEMLGLGAAVTAVAYGSGAAIASLLAE